MLWVRSSRNSSRTSRLRVRRRATCTAI
jgi:hypothetical protein